MTEPKTLPPLSAFGPELRAIYTSGANGRIELDFPTLREARNLQARLHQFRKKLQAVADPFYAVAAGVRLSLVSETQERNKPAKLIAQPHDKQYGDVLSRAGVKIDEAVGLKTENSGPTSIPFDPLDDIGPKKGDGS